MFIISRDPRIVIPLSLVLTKSGVYLGISYIWLLGVILLPCLKIDGTLFKNIVFIVSLMFISAFKFPNGSNDGQFIDVVIMAIACLGLMVNYFKCYQLTRKGFIPK